MAASLSALGVGCCVAWGRLHWGGLLATDLGIVTAITSLLLHRSRAGWCVLVVAFLALGACALIGRAGQGLFS